jgi:bleomycin hydrolase
MDYTDIDVPKSMDEFKTVYSSPAISQGTTNTCWSFSTLSYIESEVKRMHNHEVRLSQSYIVYWEYIEKVKAFIQTRGETFIGEGSESNAVTRIMKKYGILPWDAFSGLKPSQPFYDHEILFEEVKKYLDNVKSSGNWNEQGTIETVKSILKYHIGEPPAVTTINGKTITPMQYMNDIIKIKPDDYIDFMSFVSSPYYTKAEFKVPDNWWHSTDYHNVPLDVWMDIIKSGIKQGYSIAIGGDVSESGINSQLGVAMIPSYDIPSQYIDENARQLRFSNGTSTDDHGVHLIGWCDKSNGMWFLIKDSGSGSRNNPQNPGYYYYHEDYVKLKMLSMTIHKDAVKDVLAKFNIDQK